MKEKITCVFVERIGRYRRVLVDWIGHRRRGARSTSAIFFVFDAKKLERFLRIFVGEVDQSAQKLFVQVDQSHLEVFARLIAQVDGSEPKA
jgi:hypothetical protein